MLTDPWWISLPGTCLDIPQTLSNLTYPQHLVEESPTAQPFIVENPTSLICFEPATCQSPLMPYCLHGKETEQLHPFSNTFCRVVVSGASDRDCPSLNLFNFHPILSWARKMVGQGQYSVCKVEVNHADIQWPTAMASAVFSGLLLAVPNSQLAFWSYRSVHVPPPPMLSERASL